MKKIIDIFIGLGLSMFVILVWAYEMVVTGDIPVVMSYEDSVKITCMLVLFLIIYSIYTRKTIYIQMNKILLLLPLVLWFMTMLGGLTYHYNKYDTIVSIIGFSITLISFLQLIYKKSKMMVKT